MWANCGDNSKRYVNDRLVKGLCVHRTADDFWTKCYEDNECKAALPGKPAIAAYRDYCIKDECEKKGLEWKSWKYESCKPWHVKGYCGLPSK